MGKMQFIWSGETELPAGWELQSHVHDFFHLAYVRKGNLVFHVDQLDYPLSEGSLILIPPFAAHGVPQDSHNLCIQDEVLFRILDPELKSLLDNNKVLILHDAAHLESLFTYILMNYRSSDSLCSVCVESFLCTILFSFLTDEPSSEGSCRGYVDTSNYSLLVQRIISYVEKSPNEKYDLTNLALSLGHNKSYICTTFRRETGVTISDYINYNRIRRILILLQYNRYNQEFYIRDLAEQFGYANPSYFNRVFKKYTGMTPMEFVNTLSMDADSQAHSSFQKYYSEHMDLKRYPIRESLEYMRGLKDVLDQTENFTL